MAGEGQMTQATSMITAPITQKAMEGDLISLRTGWNMVSARPHSSSILAMETMREMMTTIPRSSLKATLMELKTACTALTRLPVMTHESVKEPMMQTRGASSLKARATRTRMTKSA